MIKKNSYTVKPVQFKLNDYFSQGVEMFRKDTGDYIIAFLFSFIMSIIPFCSFLAQGNFMKFCRNKKQGKNPSTSDIFDFQDFMPYFILQLIIFGAIILMYIPFMFINFGFGTIFNNDGGMPIALVVYFIVLVILLFYVSVKSFFMVPLISLEKITDFKESWKMSNLMTKTNFVYILLFIILVSILGSLGMILCYVGLFITLPLAYVIYYVAYEDGIEQIKDNEIETIGEKNP